MIKAFSLSELARAIPGSQVIADVQVQNISTDSRSVRPGETYLALKGQQFDGHDFVADALAKGAAAIIVEHQFDVDIPQLLVPDSLNALAAIANLNRQQTSGKVIALTGSAGKTSTKEMLLTICSLQGNAIATQANLNNNFGVPFTLLRIDASTQYSIVEIGTNQQGEVAFSSVCAEPDIGIILNASEAHYEGFGSLESIRAEKSDLINGIRKSGVVVLNADDAAYGLWRKKALKQSLKVISFGIKTKQADYVANKVAGNPDGRFSFELQHKSDVISISLQTVGRHQVANALAAAASAHCAGVTMAHIKQGLEAFQGVSKRLEIVAGINESLIYNDTYNASPVSVFAGLDLMSDISGRTIAVLGDMAELGGESLSIHKAISLYAERKADIVFFYGSQFSAAAVKNVYRDKQTLIEAVKRMIQKNDRILVKGANCMKMQDVVNALKKESAQ